MPKCPHCEEPIAGFDDIEYVLMGDDHQPALANGKAMYSCPSCESVLGIGEWHGAV